MMRKYTSWVLLVSLLPVVSEAASMDSISADPRHDFALNFKLDTPGTAPKIGKVLIRVVDSELPKDSYQILFKTSNGEWQIAESRKNLSINGLSYQTVSPDLLEPTSVNFNSKRLGVSIQSVPKKLNVNAFTDIGLNFRDGGVPYHVDFPALVALSSLPNLTKKAPSTKKLKLEFDLALSSGSGEKIRVPCEAEVEFSNSQMKDRVFIYIIDSNGKRLPVKVIENIRVVRIPFDPHPRSLSTLKLKPARADLIVAGQSARPVLSSLDRLDIAFKTSDTGFQYGNFFNHMHLMQLIEQKYPYLTENTVKDFKVESRPETSETEKIRGPESQDGLLNPQLRERVKSMQTEVSKRIFGQEYAVQKISAAVKAQVANPGGKSPASILLIGTTGTGKTELAKEIALARYGSKNAFVRLDMGAIKTEKDLSNLFNGTRGYIGSDEITPFEMGLKKMEQGGVFIFDEISNAGGTSISEKNAILKYFYPILDEGEWLSLKSNKTYSLKNYTFVFTGNDLENHFQAVKGDDLLASVYDSLIRNPEEIEAELISSGFPEAFLGRMKSLVLMKPPSIEVKQQIAAKLIQDWKNQFTKDQFFEVEFRGDFKFEMANLLYTQRKGGRSIRNFIDTTLGSLAADAIFEFNWDELKAHRGLIKLWIESNQPNKPFYARNPENTSARLYVQAVQDGKIVFDSSVDFSRDSQFISQIRKIDAWGTAFHEAGHAVLNDPAISGKTLEVVTIVPNGNYLGYARYEPVPGYRTNLTREKLVHEIAISLAGIEAETILGRPRNTGGKNDFNDIRNLLKKIVLETSLMPELARAELDQNGTPVLDAELQAQYSNYTESVLSDARTYANQKLQANWAWVTLTAKKLMMAGQITGQDVKDLKIKAQNSKWLNSYSPARIRTFMDRMSAHCDLWMTENQ